MRSSPGSKRWLPMLVLGLVLAAAPASAQPAPSPEAQARALFQEGLRFADHGDWERAVHRFRRALAARASAPIRYNLARSLAQLQRSAEALLELERLRGDASAGEEVQAAAARLRAEIERRRARLIVEVRGEAGGALVTVDGLPIRADEVGTPTPVDPGVRVARLLRGAQPLDVQEVEVPRGGLARVVLQAGAPPAETSGQTDGWVLPVAVGAVLVAVAASVAIGVAVSDADASASSDGLVVVAFP